MFPPSILDVVETDGRATRGLSRTNFGAISLPLDLSPIGMKGCSLLTSFDFQWIIPSQLGMGIFTMPISWDTNLHGVSVYFQAVGADAVANQLGLVTSNGVEAKFGFR